MMMTNHNWIRIYRQSMGQLYHITRNTDWGRSQLEDDPSNGLQPIQLLSIIHGEGQLYRDFACPSEWHETRLRDVCSVYLEQSERQEVGMEMEMAKKTNQFIN